MLLRFFSKVPRFQASIYDTNQDIPSIVNNSDFQLKPFKGSSKSRRSAVLALKQGMTAMWDKWGIRHALTVLQVDRCQVVQVKSYKDEYRLQLGVGERAIHRVTKPLVGHYMKADVPPKKSLMECKVSQNCLLPLGYQLMAQHFLVGQWVDVKGITKGKGFQGGIKRWNFNRQTTTHGNSVTTRTIGSTGQRQDPGRTFPGKKMPGRLGGSFITTQKLQVYKIDAERNLLYIRGSVPGGRGAVIRVSDSCKDLSNQYRTLPYPTFLGDDSRPKVEIMTPPVKDPIEEAYLHDNAFPEIKDEEAI
jgi:large subunit ribosomal protein L3